MDVESTMLPLGTKLPEFNLKELTKNIIKIAIFPKIMVF